jgi:hypothetical protein
MVLEFGVNVGLALVLGQALAPVPSQPRVQQRAA